MLTRYLPMARKLGYRYVLFRFQDGLWWRIGGRFRTQKDCTECYTMIVEPMFALERDPLERHCKMVKTMTWITLPTDAETVDGIRGGKVVCEFPTKKQDLA